MDLIKTREKKEKNGSYTAHSLGMEKNKERKEGRKEPPRPSIKCRKGKGKGSGILLHLIQNQEMEEEEEGSFLHIWSFFTHQRFECSEEEVQEKEEEAWVSNP